MTRDVRADRRDLSARHVTRSVGRHARRAIGCSGFIRSARGRDDAVEQKNLLAGNLPPVQPPPSPRLAVRPPNQVHLKSNQDKDFTTNQLKSSYIKSNYIKSNHPKDKDFPITNQLKGNYLKSNHSKDKDFTTINQLKSNHLKSNQYKE